MGKSLWSSKCIPLSRDLASCEKKQSGLAIWASLWPGQHVSEALSLTPCLVPAVTPFLAPASLGVRMALFPSRPLHLTQIGYAASVLQICPHTYYYIL